eukprot:TRINITY_DN8155_c0_g2_i1.p1 TRINITY_DN8155_c0_g2~~TRINITY_DN8155_c0_g2_i1.p1  ORF type:complete len:216 (+),score=61.18 TRINITY_DN8155_c0_g2_i1:47-649(+)
MDGEGLFSSLFEKSNKRKCETSTKSTKKKRKLDTNEPKEVEKKEKKNEKEQESPEREVPSSFDEPSEDSASQSVLEEIGTDSDEHESFEELKKGLREIIAEGMKEVEKKKNLPSQPYAPKTVFVGGVPYVANKTAIRNFFKSQGCGRIIDTRIVTNCGGRNSFAAFLDFSTSKGLWSRRDKVYGKHFRCETRQHPQQKAS